MAKRSFKISLQNPNPLKFPSNKIHTTQKKKIHREKKSNTKGLFFSSF